MERILEEAWGNGEKVDRVLLGWEKGWLGVWERSTGSQWAYERILGELEGTERAVERGEKVSEFFRVDFLLRLSRSNLCVVVDGKEWILWAEEEC